MNLNTTIEIDLKGFFRWWAEELVFLLPKTLLRRLRDRQGQVVFSLLDTGYCAEYFNDDGVLVSRQALDLADENAVRDWQSNQPAMQKAEWILRLDQAHALCRRLRLPAAALENLQHVVGFEMDRYTPFRPEQVYFAAVALGKTEQGQADVLMLAAPKPQLDEQLADLQVWGVRPQRVDYRPMAEQYPGVAGKFDLLPPQYRPKAGKIAQLMQWTLGFTLTALLVAVSVLPIWQEAQAVAELKLRVKQLESDNRLVDVQQREIDQLRVETEQLLSIKREAPALLAVLDELTKLLNDDTWLTHMNYADRHLQIQGQSPAASELIGILENSAFFNHVSFVSPLTQDKTTGRERFQISMDVGMPARARLESADLPLQTSPSANDISNDGQWPEPEVGHE